MSQLAYEHSVVDRIARSVEFESSGCWTWQLSKSSGGYGRMWVLEFGVKRLRQAHRVSYEALVDPIPDGLQIDHLCRVRSCVNPDHLEPVTSAENTRRGVYPSKRQSRCLRGHAFDERNTRMTPSGQQYCRTCDRLRKANKKQQLLATGAGR
jgi:hypothetical protein